MTIVTRFAPSPTGFLHIGGARTALFNWLFARHHGGKALLRIEDTDRARSTEEAVAAIIDGLDWLGLDWDEPPLFQSTRQQRHSEVVDDLLAKGRAYRCYCSAEELTEMRERARAEGRAPRYDGRWRDRDPSEAPEGVAPAIRLRAPQEGETVIEDKVQGRVRIANEQLDDLILLRSDGSPTYMLSVVVDDHDMGVTHVIRGDDHLTNAARQIAIFDALDWVTPVFAHIPLIHGPDGAKLSKRHGALGVEAYREMGYLPEALCNYLLRLGWSHGDEEVISRDAAIQWFDLDAVGKSAARFDFKKLENLNGLYIRETEDARLTGLVRPLIEEELDRTLNQVEADRLLAAMPGLKQRARLLPDLAESASFLFASVPLQMTEKAEKLLDHEARVMLSDLLVELSSLKNWHEDELEETVRGFAEKADLKLGKVAQPLRAALTGSTTSPGLFEVLVVLGRDESLDRIGAVCGTAAT